MPAMPKRIDFEDIREGDTIRVVDVVDVKVVENRGHEFATREHGIFLQESYRSGTNRKFQLIDRLIPALPTKPGSVVELHSEGGKWVLIRETHGNDRMVWVRMANGTRQSPTFMRHRVSNLGGFEVIL